MSDETSHLPKMSARTAVIALAVIYCALVVPVVATGAQGTSESRDQRVYHLPIVRTMMEQWPRVDIVEYESATSPGYHLLLAAAWRLTGAEWTVFAINTLSTLALLLVVMRFLLRVATPVVALALVLPLTLNPYVLGSAVWITTDNAAMVFVALVVSGAALGPFTVGRSLRLGVYAGVAVFIRQIHAWLIAPVGLFGLLASPAALMLPAALRRFFCVEAGKGRWGALVVACASAAVPALVVAWLVWLWGGLTPKAIGFAQVHAGGPNAAAPALALALCAVFGVAMLTTVEGLVDLARRTRVACLVCAIVGLVSGLVPATSYLELPRAFGWFWRVVGLLPAPMERSVVIAVAAPVGAAALALLHANAVRAGRGRASGVVLLSMLAWVAAQSANSMAWQRYFDPMVLIGVSWLAALGWRAGRGATARALAGPALLTIAHAALSAVTLYREAVGDLMSR